MSRVKRPKHGVTEIEAPQWCDRKIIGHRIGAPPEHLVLVTVWERRQGTSYWSPPEHLVLVTFVFQTFPTGGVGGFLAFVVSCRNIANYGKVKSKSAAQS